MTVIDQLTVQFSADFKELSRELQKAQGETSRAMKGMEGALKPIGTAFRTLGAIAAAAGVSLSVDFAKRTLDAVGGIGELAEQLGTSTEMLQVYEFAAAQAGVEQGQLEASLSKLTKTLGDAAAGEETAVKAFRALGVSVLDAKGNIRETDAVIADIADKIASVQDPAKRAALVVDVFGKSGQRLLPILSQGAAGLQDWRRQAHETGSVIGDSLIGKADAASDSLAAMTKSFETLAKQLVAMAAGPIKDFADAWVNALKKINENSRFQKGLDEQKDHIKLLQEERRLIEQIGQMKGAVGPNPLPQDAAAIRKLEERVAEIRAQVTAGSVPPVMPTSGPVARTGGGTIPRTQAEIDKARKDFEKKEEALSEKLLEIDERKTEVMLANRQSYTDAVIASGIAITNAEKAHQDELAKQMNAVAEGTRNLAEANAKIAEDSAKAASEAVRELGLAFSSAFEDAIVKGNKLADVLKGLAQDLLRIAVRKNLTEPLLAGASGLFDGGFFGKLFGRASGGHVNSGQPYMVGEHGPEVFMPSSSGSINPGGGRGGMTVNYSIDARGADASVLPRIEAMMARTKAESVSLALSAVQSRNARVPSYLGR